MTNIGSAGPAAPAAAGGAAAAPAEAAAEEKKEEGKNPGLFRCDCLDSGANSKQRRRSPTRTWASVSSTKRPLPSDFRFLFLFHLLSPSAFDFVPDTPQTNESPKREKKNNLRTGACTGDGRFACMMGFAMTEVLDRMPLRFRIYPCTKAVGLSSPVIRLI